MTTTNTIKEGLMEQGRHNGAGSSDVNQTVQAILARDEARVKRMRILTILAWLALPIDIIVVMAMKSFSDSRLAEPVGIIVFQVLLLIAVIFIISLYVRSRTLTMNQIQSRLSKIETLLNTVIRNEQKP